ncbi:MAG: PIG-L family deacetylase [Chthoniobacterales bacterium]
MRSLLTATIMWTLHTAQAIEPQPSGQLQLSLEKLNTLGSVLYLAAHPDDENTKLIAWFANESRYHTTYLSLTRGDGGQNLLGVDLGERLGLIRTQELLAARAIDGGQQRFTRANDFGYSKTPEETLQIWGKDAILSDIVRIIRSTRPDVIISRFSLEPGYTHGHHTAAALLAKEAFTAAADPSAFPEQLQHLTPWAPRRLLWNTSHWFYSRRNIPFDPTGMLRLDTGTYSPLLGTAYPEIAARSRSAHKTQGFGATPELGESPEYFVHLTGEKTTTDLFQGIDTTWNRVPDSQPVAAAIQKAIAAFTPANPAAAIPHLLTAHKALTQLPDQFWRTQKLHELENVIAACLGLDVESLSSTPTAVSGQEITLTLNAIQRSPHNITIQFQTPDNQTFPKKNATLAPNKLLKITHLHRLPATLEISQPYWLKDPHPYGHYTVADSQQIGSPENPPTLPVTIRLTIDGHPLTYTIPTTYKKNDPVRGEVKEPFVVTPPAMVNLSAATQIFGNSQPQKLTARIIAKTDIAKGELRFLSENGWQTNPATIPFTAHTGEELTLHTTLTPPKIAGETTLRAELQIDEKTYTRGYERITYDHIPTQTIFPIAQTRLVMLDVKTAGYRIGYIPGAGDAIPEALQRIGYTVETLTESDMTPEKLAPCDTIILGIRALNTNDRIRHYLPALFDYAKNGGVVILQYNTDRNLKTETIAPYPLTLSRDRVTDETAPIEFLAPDHPVLNFPNKITSTDFDNWVQERGLYFANKWDPAFIPILASHDPNEAPLKGGLLIAKHGKGWFIYTGLSWFRQLPAGVPGAYRLFANLVSLGHADKEGKHR